MPFVARHLTDSAIYRLAGGRYRADVTTTARGSEQGSTSEFKEQERGAPKINLRHAAF